MQRRGDTYPDFAKLVAAMGVNVGEVAGIAAAAVNVLASAAATVGIAVYAVFALAVGVYVATGGGVAALAIGPAVVAGAAGLSAASVVGAVLIPLLAVLIGIAAAIELFTNIENINTINTNLTNGLNKASTPPDLYAMATDTTGLGFYKLELTLASQTVPEVASTAVLPMHQASDLNFAYRVQHLPSTLTYKDWNGNTRSRQTWGGWFVETCANGSGSTCDQPNSIIASLHYKDWSGEKWTASRMGSSFVSIKAKAGSTEYCRVQPTRSPSSRRTPIRPSVRATFPTASRCQDGNGNNVNVSFSLLAPPVFTSPATFAFGPSIQSSVTITAKGNPAPSGFAW